MLQNSRKVDVKFARYLANQGRIFFVDCQSITSSSFLLNQLVMIELTGCSCSCKSVRNLTLPDLTSDLQIKSKAQTSWNYIAKLTGRPNIVWFWYVQENSEIYHWLPVRSLTHYLYYYYLHDSIKVKSSVLWSTTAWLSYDGIVTGALTCSPLTHTDPMGTLDMHL